MVAFAGNNERKLGTFAARDQVENMQEAQTVQQHITSGPAQTQRVIKRRITIRGFKDMVARFLENYAGPVNAQASRQWCRPQCGTDGTYAPLTSVMHVSKESPAKSWLKRHGSHCAK